MNSYIYIDGNNNSYYISHNQAIYDPVKPEFSSSGSYSGGEMMSAGLNKDQFSGFEAFIKEVTAQEDAQIDARVKGSGLLTVKTGLNKKDYILDMDSEAKNALENALYKLLNP